VARATPDALLLPPREPRGHAILEAGELHSLEPISHPIPDLLLGHGGHPAQRERNVLVDRQVVKEGVVLEEHAKVGAELLKLDVRHGEDVLPLDHNTTSLGTNQSRGDLQKYALAAGAGADQPVEAALRHLKGDLPEHPVVPKGFLDPVDLDHEELPAGSLRAAASARRLRCQTISSATAGRAQTSSARAAAPRR
jgi:hypothetical protein